MHRDGHVRSREETAVYMPRREASGGPVLPQLDL